MKSANWKKSTVLKRNKSGCGTDHQALLHFVDKMFYTLTSENTF